MANTELDSILGTATDESFQARAKGGIQSNAALLWWLAKAGMSVYPWWSPYRDRELREFWKRTDHLAGAVYAMEAKMTAIPFKIIAKDQSNQSHVAQAERVTALLQAGAEFGDGWEIFYSKYLEDLLTQDNGAFAEIIGPGSPDGPLTGAPLTVAHLDSFRCTRTGDPIYPVLYRDLDGKQYKLHYTRVMFTSQMASPIADMFGVGFCAVSRCQNVAQNVLDILVYKQEKLGSRPKRALLVPKGGLDPKDLQDAFALADADMNASGLSRYSKYVVVGSSTLPEAEISITDLASLPEGFDEKTSIELGIAAIALAFGVDARELFPATSSGATRADALLQHIKQRGKGPGQIIQTTEQLFNHKFLPSHLTMVFDFQDDAQDRQIAEIRRIRSDRRKVDIDSGMIDERVAREQMLEAGDLTQDQFEYLELENGRLPDGTDVLTLYYSTDPLVKKYLKLEGVQDPVDLQVNDPQAVLEAISQKRVEVYKAVASETSHKVQKLLRQVLAALETLEGQYTKQQMADEAALALEQSGQQGGKPSGPSSANGEGGGKRPPEERNQYNRRSRRLNLSEPNQKVELNASDSIRPSPDDNQN